MDRTNDLFLICALLLCPFAVVAQDTSAPPSGSNVTTVRGCLRGQRNNYILIEDKTTQIYVLKGVGNKLDKFRRREVEVKGTILPGRIKTGVRPEKEGSNPADTVHSVDGVPLQVANIETDIRTIAQHCTAADQQ